MATQQQPAVQNAQPESLQALSIKAKNTIANSVLKKVEEATKTGGISIPKNYNAGNQVNLALLVLNDTERNGKPLLTTVSQSSVANALFRMVILGMSLDRKQCDFIPYGDRLNFQLEYHGRIALAKRLGGAGEPRAQVIYADDEFEYVIDPDTGNKRVTKHIQKIQNIDNDKIVGAWCLIPYADHPERQPYVEIMTMAEIRQAWMQGATKGNSPAHRNFTQEMAKKTVISRACKLFITTSDEAGLYSYYTGENGEDEDAKKQNNAVPPQQKEVPEFKDVESVPAETEKETDTGNGVKAEPVTDGTEVKEDGTQPEDMPDASIFNV